MGIPSRSECVRHLFDQLAIRRDHGPKSVAAYTEPEIASSTGISSVDTNRLIREDPESVYSLEFLKRLYTATNWQMSAETE